MGHFFNEICPWKSHVIWLFPQLTRSPDGFYDHFHKAGNWFSQKIISVESPYNVLIITREIFYVIFQEPAVEQTSDEAKKAQKALAEMTDKVSMLESDLAVSEAENDDMVRQLEESKGLYLILEKKYHITKNKLKELEDR